MLNEHEVIDDIKQHEYFTLTFRVLDLTSRGLNGVSGASLGGVDQCGYPRDQGSKTAKVLLTVEDRNLHWRETTRVSGCWRQLQRA